MFGIGKKRALKDFHQALGEKDRQAALASLLRGANASSEWNLPDGGTETPLRTFTRAIEPAWTSLLLEGGAMVDEATACTAALLAEQVMRQRKTRPGAAPFFAAKVLLLLRQLDKAGAPWTATSKSLGSGDCAADVIAHACPDFLSQLPGVQQAASSWAKEAGLTCAPC